VAGEVRQYITVNENPYTSFRLRPDIEFFVGDVCDGFRKINKQQPPPPSPCYKEYIIQEEGKKENTKWKYKNQKTKMNIVFHKNQKTKMNIVFHTIKKIEI